MDTGERAFIGGGVGDDVHVEGDAEVGDVVCLIGSDYEYEFGADHFQGVGYAGEDEFSAQMDEEFGLIRLA